MLILLPYFEPAGSDIDLPFSAYILDLSLLLRIVNKSDGAKAVT